MSHNKERSKAYFQRKAAEIRALNPKLFDKKRPSVLSKSIKAQLVEALPHMGAGVINKFLLYWVRRDRYLSATIMCPSRMNLDGSFAEPITDKEKTYAKDELRKKRTAKKPRNTRKQAGNKAKKLAPSEAALRQRAVLEKAGRGLNFAIQSKKPDVVTVTTKKRKRIIRPDGSNEWSDT